MDIEKMNDDQNFLEVESTVFKEGQTLEEYKKDIKKYLMLCGYRYTSEDADERIKTLETEIKYRYERKEPVDEAALEIGYCCG